MSFIWHVKVKTGKQTPKPLFPKQFEMAHKVARRCRHSLLVCACDDLSRRHYIQNGIAVHLEVPENGP